MKLLTFLTIENIKTLHSYWPDNKEWHWTVFLLCFFLFEWLNLCPSLKKWFKGKLCPTQLWELFFTTIFFFFNYYSIVSTIQPEKCVISVDKTSARSEEGGTRNFLTVGFHLSYISYNISLPRKLTSDLILDIGQEIGSLAKLVQIHNPCSWILRFKIFVYHTLTWQKKWLKLYREKVPIVTVDHLSRETWLAREIVHRMFSFNLF